MQADERLESYRTLLDKAYEFLSPIMSKDQIENMPYKELLYELERRRIYLESNRDVNTQRELEKQLKEMKKK